MKVLHVINSLAMGGAESLLVQSAPIYLTEGIEIEILVLRNDSNGWMQSFVESNPQMKIINLESKNIYNPIIALNLVSIIRKYDVVHVHLFPSSYWVAIAAYLNLKRINVVFTEHSTHNRRRESILFRIFDRLIYRCFKYVICITEGTRKNLIKHLGYKDSAKFVVIPNGIDLTIFNSVKKSFDFFGEGDRVLIQVSSFRPQKDQSTVIKALLLLPSNVKLLLVGDGPLRNDCETLVQQLELEDRVLFLGLRTDVPSLLSYADVNILSSNYEGFGLAIVEGMAANKPSIASNISGVAEIVQDYGILFEKGNEVDLSEKIKLLLNDQSYYDVIARRCYERAKQFDINLMVKNYINLYRKII